jgi:hypothetical protein
MLLTKYPSQRVKLLVNEMNSGVITTTTTQVTLEFGIYRVRISTGEWDTSLPQLNVGTNCFEYGQNSTLNI